MNLWAKRIGQLTLLAVALFFLSCEDETSILGFKNPNEKFDIRYVDIPVTSSTMLIDSVRSSNYYVSNDLNRWLVGQYEDPEFGTITASAYTQFLPTNYPSTNKAHRDTTYYIVDSITLKLNFDWYAYGADDGPESNLGMLQKINIHELTQQLSVSTSTSVNNNTGGQQIPTETIYNRANEYFTNTVIGYDPAVVGSREYYVNLKEWDFQANSSSDLDSSLTIKLNLEFGQRLFDLALTDTIAFRTGSTFVTKFPGLAFIPELNDKIVGFDPRLDSSKIQIYYRTMHTGPDTLIAKSQVNFRFSNLVSYNKISADRSSSDLSFLSAKYQPDEDGETRYIQSATGVVVKLDFSKFLEFADTIERLAINSAELKINNINIASDYHNLPPKNLVVKVLKSNNRFKELTYPGRGSAYTEDITNLNAFNGYVSFDSRNTLSYNALPADSTLNILNDGGSFFTLSYSNDDNWYRGSANLFFQQFFNNKDDESISQFTSVALYPYEPSLSPTLPFGRHIYGKTINRVSFDKDDIVLRIYYTVPVSN